ncbi:hypothetical protein EJ08DRAFT_643658 [Tothia fuscella]|uniref:alpha-galactosidase n=1 Tax=Tothia fuscella TaxID=1048955 RepID=A0A9P4NEM9_9PEZI|nr:hypothetical protein EJ08DRAFT_643658 [Tothia fuscella]
MKSLLLSSFLASTSLAAVIQRDATTSAIWQPTLGAKWQIILRSVPLLTSGLTPNDAEIWDVDLFDTPTDTIKALKQAGKKVICYFSAGTSEDWRDDYDQFQQADKGSCMGDWVGERWLDTRQENVFNIMKKRIQLAKTKGCDAIDPDNMDGFTNNNGLGLDRVSGIKYMRRLAKEAASQGLSTGLKNAQAFLPDVANDVAFAVNEQCASFEGDCESYKSLTALSKPIFHIEYSLTGDALKNALCLTGTPSQSSTFSTVLKTMDLDGFVLYCDGGNNGNDPIDPSEKPNDPENPQRSS